MLPRKEILQTGQHVRLEDRLRLHNHESRYQAMRTNKLLAQGCNAVYLLPFLGVSEEGFAAEQGLQTDCNLAYAASSLLSYQCEMAPTKQSIYIICMSTKQHLQLSADKTSCSLGKHQAPFGMEPALSATMPELDMQQWNGSPLAAGFCLTQSGDLCEGQPVVLGQPQGSRS